MHKLAALALTAVPGLAGMGYAKRGYGCVHGRYWRLRVLGLRRRDIVTRIDQWRLPCVFPVGY
jgi:hypothetical protein